MKQKIPEEIIKKFCANIIKIIEEKNNIKITYELKNRDK